VVFLYPEKQKAREGLTIKAGFAFSAGLEGLAPGARQQEKRKRLVDPTSAGRLDDKAGFAFSARLKRLEGLGAGARHREKRKATGKGWQSKYAASCGNDCMTYIL